MKSCKKFVQNCDGHATHAICTIFMDQNILAMHHLVVAIRKMPQKYFHFGFHRGQTHQSNQRESPNLQSSMNLPVIGMKPVSMKSRVGQASAILSPDNSSKLGKRGSPIITTSAVKVFPCDMVSQTCHLPYVLMKSVTLEQWASRKIVTK
jgi:hypothetical protein